MNYKTTFGLFLLFWFICPNAYSQPDFTANDQVPAYNQAFRYGSNFGNYPPWSNQQVADIAAGFQGLSQEGLGLKAHRPGMPESFFEFWGYDVRLADFEYFRQLDILENIAFLGFPSDAHRDQEMYCPEEASESFANLYEPIWDNGQNNTPVNDDNFFALYVYKMVSRYKDYIRFWEVWNEPDYSPNPVTWAAPGEPGNWWENTPDPCDLAFRAPVYHYVRMLRIAYEVIKTVDPTAYVCTGGIGNPAFLDAVLRNTDNPANGGVTTDYPLKGGAYFDVLSYHAYPHIDGSMLEWVNGVGLVWHRHSDRGVEGILARKEAFQNVLSDYGYTGTSYPEKLWILSETNLPRKEYQNYIGSVEAQRNFIIKAFVEAQKNEILQVDVFTISELENEDNAWNEYQLMGLFENLSDYSYPDHQITDAGIAFKTTSDLLYGKAFDPVKTAEMQLPEGIKGAAFLDEEGKHIYVLWARTSQDNDETASATYSFPQGFGLEEVAIAQWNFGLTRDTVKVDPQQINLTGAPMFIAEEIQGGQPVDVTDEALKSSLNLEIFPNPFRETVQISLKIVEHQVISIDLYSSKGQKIDQLLETSNLSAGLHHFSFVLESLPPGVYWISVSSEYGKLTRKLIAN